MPSDYITISNVSASGTGAGDTTTQLIRPGMQISGEVSVIADSTASTSLSIPGFFGNTLTVGMFITGLNVPTEETKVTAVSYNGGVTTVLLNNALTAGTQTRFAFSYIYGGTWYCSANAAASNTGSNTTLGTGLGGNDWFRSVLHLPILIQSQVSGTPGREGVYRLNQVNLAAAAKVTGFVNIYGELKGAPIIAQGKRIRVDIIIDPNTGQQSGYLNGILAVQTRNGQAAAFTSSYGILESPSSESRTLEFGISAHLPDFYTSNSNALPTHYPAGYTGLGILTPGDWQLWNTVNVSYGASGAVEISVNPYIECISDAIYMTLSSTTAKPVTYYPQLMAKATIKCKVPFRSVRFGTPGTTEEVGIWVYTNGSGNRVNTISGTDAGGYGGMVVQAVNSQYSIA